MEWLGANAILLEEYLENKLQTKVNILNGATAEGNKTVEQLKNEEKIKEKAIVELIQNPTEEIKKSVIEQIPVEQKENIIEEEIEIIKYVGGSDNFIRMPFIVEGFTIGFIGSTIALFICIYMYEYILENINNAINFMNNNMMIPVSEIAIFLAFVLFITGITIGVLGSIISVKRHLKV